MSQPRTQRSSAAVELTLGVVYETEKAWLVTNTGYGADAVWIPKVYSERGERKRGRDDPPDCKGGVWEFEVAEFIAEERGLI